ncbi:response regulator transcription factor [Stenotrophomonas sp. TWI809]|uniref:response regulator transcription factor n=1 Tax=unclassified Stenotrophomonas TaxID=196198 RepID=UPI0032094EFE
MDLALLEKPRCRGRSVVLADDHTLVAQGIERLLMNSFESIVLVSDGEKLIETVERDPPDVVVADISMPGISGIDAMKEILERGCRVPFVFLTMHDEPSLAAGAIRAGARGFVLKSAAGEELIFAIKEVLNGNTYVSASVAAQAIIHGSTTQYIPTDKQLRVLELLALGLRAKQIAHKLGLSVRTVESHKYAMMQELGVHGTIELVRKAEALGVVFLRTEG